MAENTEKKGFNMSKSMIGLIVAGVILVLYLISSYNGMVSKEETVDESWGKVQNKYQRRADLIPNLVNVVKGYATHEKETLEGVVNARAKATQITISADNLDEETLKKYQAAQGELSQALGKLMAVAEAYPDLKANENFLQFQAQLEGTENRITEARNNYNETVKEYNLKVRRFPGSIVASIFGFDKKAMFEADANAQKAPEVKF